MDRTLFRVAAVIATAVLAIASADARAQTVDAPADAGATGAEQPPPADVTAASPAPVTPPDRRPQPEAATQAPSPSDAGAQPGVDTTGGTEPGAAPEQTAGQATSPSGSTDNTAPAPAGADTPANPPASDAAATNPPAEPAAGSTTTPAESPTIALSEFTASTAGDTPPPQSDAQEGPVTLVPAPALLDPIGPGSGEARPPLDGREETLPELLPRVDRELRSVQVQIEQVQHQLVEGTTPPPSGLVQLRRSLEWIAPALLALEVRLDAAGRLTPRLRELLRRVRTRLIGTRASAAGLITALRRSGLRGPELRLLLRELESFGALDVALDWNPVSLPPPSPANAGTGVTYTQMLSAPAAAQPYVSPAPEARGAGRSAPAAPSDGGGPDEPPPWSSVPGSATASPGGAFFVAGLASLATLLIALALPRLWSRLELPRRRRYAVVFLAPLERPG